MAAWAALGSNGRRRCGNLAASTAGNSPDDREEMFTQTVPGSVARPRLRGASVCHAPRFLFYSHDTVGMGNIRRTLLLARELAQAYPESSTRRGGARRRLTEGPDDEPAADLIGIPVFGRLLSIGGELEARLDYTRDAAFGTREDAGGRLVVSRAPRGLGSPFNHVRRFDPAALAGLLARFGPPRLVTEQPYRYLLMYVDRA